MRRKPLPLVLLVVVFTVLAALGCTRGSPESSVEEDFEQTLEVYRQAETHLGKVEPLFAFIDRHPGSAETARIVAYLAETHFLIEERDPRGAVDFLHEYMARAESGEVRRRYEESFFALAGENGVEEVLTEEEWERIRDYGEESIASLTPEKLREEAGDEEPTDRQIAERIREGKEQAFQRIALARIHLGETEAGLATFEEGSEFLSTTAAGFPYSEYPTCWAKALIESGEPRRAIEIVAPRAVILGNEAALSVLEAAYLAAGEKASEFDVFVDKTRQRIAREAPAFAGFNYDGERIRVDAYDGRVTLLAFWFPT